ncbi:MAG: hypothetical protein JWM27_3733 [Gemmatimonadetes bacterium]|nr:hypothetical protein [Gemmatimonadota bacterium]
MSHDPAARAERRAPTPAAARPKGSPRGHGRYSPVPPVPSLPRHELAVLRDHAGPLGLLFWQCLSDVLLWAAADRREGLFHPRGRAQAEALAYTLREVPELADPVAGLVQVSAMPELAVPARVADACEQVMRWAEQHGMKETAAQFAEAAARIEPDRSSRCYTAGRTCRHVGDAGRAALWFRRAERLARRAGNQIDFAIAHLGYGNLENDLGRFAAAKDHLGKAERAALRVGKRSLAAAVQHDLMAVSIHAGELTEAVEHAQKAVDLYPRRHVRLPELAHDVAFLWLRCGHFSSALAMLEKAVPKMEFGPHRMLALATIARSAAAVRDKIRYERASEEVLRYTVRDAERAASCFYHLAEGARSFQQEARATDLATRALAAARERENVTVVGLAERLIESIRAGREGDVDTVPPAGSAIDIVTQALLERVERMPAPARGAGTGSVPDVSG